MATRVIRPRFARLAASPLPRACIALTKSEEKERLLAVYHWFLREMTLEERGQKFYADGVSLPWYG